jgi:hypothetical protein
MRVYVADAYVYVQGLVSVVKMTTVRAECIVEAAFCCAFLLWAKGLNAKDIHKEMLPVYAGKCLSRKAVHSWVEKRGKRIADDEEVEMEVQKWLRRQSKDFYAVGFDALVKRWDRCINVGGGYVEE